MGRELRRVPLDFKWPLEKIWKGFINPHWKPCPAAERNECRAGSTNGGQWLDAICRFLALLGEQAVSEPHAYELRARGQIFPHPYLESFAQAPHTDIPDGVMSEIRKLPDGDDRLRALQRYRRDNPMKLLPLTEEIASLITGLAGERPSHMSGAMYGWKIQKKIIKAAGMPKDFGICKVCKGEGIDPAALKAYNAWQPEPPPSGEGWQLWETVSEGSPISKVYATREEFVAYLVGEGYSHDAAWKFSEIGWAMSMVRTGDGTILKDIESCR